ncbi:hypothetical protein SAMN05421840_11779 [Shewanella morhuae]|uniref:hypothetical protein n=1 Tax=Shewanella morhuae TaxID=365591 RepID=UPI000953C7B4|nr:hypothetical protein [Shewanella morhuae]SIR36581.1 hypothetical protein SAMN05421840_11779 [Shewanella morhuae]
MHENFESEVQAEFSEWYIDIQLDRDVDITKDNKISFLGNLKRCYEFKAEEFDCDELIDGCFENQLGDMELEVIYCCEMVSYDATLTSFSWADDELVETMLN